MVITLIQRLMFSNCESGTRNGAFRVGKHYSQVDSGSLKYGAMNLGTHCLDELATDGEVQATLV